MIDRTEQPPAVADPVRVGDVLADKYRVVRRLGQGGMGAIFEAQHLLLHRRFALKLLRPDLAKRAGMIERFRREASAAGRIEHEHVAAVTDLGVAPGGTPYLVMEYLVGQPLSRLIEREAPLASGRAVRLMIQAGRGLMAAHAQGVIHRDLKPDNLFVCPREDGSEHIKVLDFGIAKLRLEGADESSLTRTGATMGTPQYMSPEQARGETAIDQRTDVYSLAAVLYEALTGKKAHPGSTYNEIIYHILTKPVSMEPMPADAPAWLIAVLERAMAPQREDRYTTMGDLVAALAHGCPARPTCSAGARPPPNPMAVTIPSANETRTTDPGRDLGSSVDVRRGPVPARSLGTRLLFAVGTAGACWFVLGGLRESGPPSTQAAVLASAAAPPSISVRATPPATTPPEISSVATENTRHDDAPNLRTVSRLPALPARTARAVVRAGTDPAPAAEVSRDYDRTNPYQ